MTNGNLSSSGACLSKPSATVTILTNGNYSLDWQDDGNLVLRTASGSAVFASDTGGAGEKICFQGDGNLVIHNSCGQAIFATATGDGQHGGNGGRKMVLQTDCNLVIRNAAGSALFSTGTFPCLE